MHARSDAAETLRHRRGFSTICFSHVKSQAVSRVNPRTGRSMPLVPGWRLVRREITPPP